MHYREKSGRPEGQIKKRREEQLLERGLLTVSVFARSVAYLEESTVRLYLEAGEDSYPPAWKALRMKAWKPDGRSWVIKLNPIDPRQLFDVTTIPLTDEERRKLAEMTARLSQVIQEGGIVIHSVVEA